MKLLRHLAGYLPVNIASGIAAFGGVYVFTRLLSPEDYGRYALMLSLLAIIHAISLTPAEAAAYRFAGQAEADNKQPDHFRTILSLTARSLIVASFLVGLAALILGSMPAYLAILPWMAALLPLGTIVQIALEAHRAQQSVTRYAIIETSRLLSGFVFGACIAWLTGFGAASPFVGLVIVTLMLALHEGRWLASQAKSGTTSPSARRAYLNYGMPIGAALLLDIILSAADRFLIAYFLGEAAVGEYTAGYGVADKTVLLLCAWAAMAGAPLVMAAYETGGRDAAAREADGLIKTILLLGVPAAAGLALVARPLGEALIGEALRDGAIEIIPWIAFAGLLNGITIHYATEVFTLAHRTKQLALLMLIPAVSNIGLNIGLIPLYGLMGAVAATLLSYGLGLIVLFAVGRSLIAFPIPIKDIAKVSLAALCMWPVIAVLPDWGTWPELLIKSATGGAVYLIAAILLDAADARSFLREKLASNTDPGT